MEMLVNSVIKLVCICFQNDAKFQTKNKQEIRLGKLNYSNEYGKKDHLLQPTNSPLQRVGYAQRDGVFSDVTWEDPLHICSLFEDKLQELTTLERSPTSLLLLPMS